MRKFINKKIIPLSLLHSPGFGQPFSRMGSICVDEEANEEEGEGGVDGKADGHVLDGLLANNCGAGRGLPFQMSNIQGDEHTDQHLQTMEYFNNFKIKNILKI